METLRLVSKTMSGQWSDGSSRPLNSCQSARNLRDNREAVRGSQLPMLPEKIRVKYLIPCFEIFEKEHKTNIIYTFIESTSQLNFIIIKAITEEAEEAHIQSLTHSLTVEAN